MTAGLPSLFINRSQREKEIINSPSMPLSLHRTCWVTAILRPYWLRQAFLSGENFLLPFAYISIVFWDMLACPERPADHPFAFAGQVGPTSDAFCHCHFRWVKYFPLLQVCSNIRFLTSYVTALVKKCAEIYSRQFCFCNLSGEVICCKTLLIMQT